MIDSFKRLVCFIVITISTLLRKTAVVWSSSRIMLTLQKKRTFIITCFIHSATWILKVLFHFLAFTINVQYLFKDWLYKWAYYLGSWSQECQNTQPIDWAVFILYLKETCFYGVNDKIVGENIFLFYGSMYVLWWKHIW